MATKNWHCSQLSRNPDYLIICRLSAAWFWSVLYYAKIMIVENQCAMCNVDFLTKLLLCDMWQLFNKESFVKTWMNGNREWMKHELNDKPKQALRQGFGSCSVYERIMYCNAPLKIYLSIRKTDFDLSLIIYQVKISQKLI